MGSNISADTDVIHRSMYQSLIDWLFIDIDLSKGQFLVALKFALLTELMYRSTYW